MKIFTVHDRAWMDEVVRNLAHLNDEQTLVTLRQDLELVEHERIRSVGYTKWGHAVDWF